MTRVKCDACAARQQTIMVLADWVDSLRKQVEGTMEGTTDKNPGFSEHFSAETYKKGLSAVPVPSHGGHPTFGPGKERNWLDEDEEEIAARIEAGDLTGYEAEAALAKVQAINTNVTIERR